MSLRRLLLFHSPFYHGDSIIRSVLWNWSKRRSVIGKIVLLNNYWVIRSAHRALFINSMIVLDCWHHILVVLHLFNNQSLLWFKSRIFGAMSSDRWVCSWRAFFHWNWERRLLGTSSWIVKVWRVLFAAIVRGLNFVWWLPLAFLFIEFFLLVCIVLRSNSIRRYRKYLFLAPMGNMVRHPKTISSVASWILWCGAIRLPLFDLSFSLLIRAHVYATVDWSSGTKLIAWSWRLWLTRDSPLSSTTLSHNFDFFHLLRPRQVAGLLWFPFQTLRWNTASRHSTALV